MPSKTIHKQEAEPEDDKVNVPEEEDKEQEAEEMNGDDVDEEEEPTDAHVAAESLNPMDLVLSRLDDIASRLNRIERALNIMPTITSATANRTMAKPSAFNSAAESLKAKSLIKNGAGAAGHLNLHFYDNEYHVLPQDWSIPRLTFEGMIVYWYLGDSSSGVPPLVKIGGSEFKTLPRGVKKRSDMKFLMKHVERKARDEGCFIENVNEWTQDAVRTLYAKTRKYFDYPSKTTAQTKFDKLSWETICHNLRKHKVLVGEELPLPSEIVDVDAGADLPETSEGVASPDDAEVKDVEMANVAEEKEGKEEAQEV